MTHSNTTWAYAALVLMLALAGLDQTVLSTALPVIAAEMHGQGQLPWVFSAYLIAYTAVIPLYGKLADRVGARPMLLVAGGFFVAGSLGCMAATSIEQLIAARALQGLGGGGLMTLTMVAVATLYTPEQRARRQGLLGAAYGVATMLGPLVGGFLVQHLSWRWAFALNVPLAALALGVLATARLGQASAARHPLDVAGAGLLAAALICMLLATRQGQAGTAESWLMLAGAGVLLAVWVWVERRAADPIVPFGLFQRPGFAATALLSVCTGVALFGAVVFLPLYLQSALRFTPIHSALQLMPLMVCLTLAANACGRAMRAGFSIRALALAGSLAMSLAYGLLLVALSQAAAQAWVFSLAVAPLGVGLGILFPVLTVVSQRAAMPQHIGIATAMPIMLRALGGAMGVSVLGLLLSRGMTAASPVGYERFASAFASSLVPVNAAIGAVTLLACAIALALPRKMPAAAGIPAMARPA